MKKQGRFSIVNFGKELGVYKMGENIKVKCLGSGCEFYANRQTKIVYCPHCRKSEGFHLEGVSL